MSIAVLIPLFALLQAGTPTVSAEAEVNVSNGRHFGATMRYAGPSDAEYVQHRPEGDNRYAITPEGASLTGPRGREALDAGMIVWILGHNFHAQLLYFDALNDGSTRQPLVEPGCDCIELRGKRGAAGLGIEYLALVVDREGGRARKLLVYRKDAAPVVSVYSDWRAAGARELPFAVDIDDGKDRYAFRFTRVVAE